MKIFGICYKPEHKTEFIRYDNNTREKAWRFEYNPMLDIIENRLEDVAEDEYIGVLSHKFTQKTGLNNYDIQMKIKSLENKYGSKNNPGIFNLSPDLKVEAFGGFMDWSAKGHGEVLRDLIKACCKHMGMVYENKPKHIVYSNFFLARKSVYVDYVETIIKPCLKLLEGPLWSLANKSAQYTAGVARTELRKTTGLDYYNYVTFVLERMAMQYIHNREIRTVSLV